MSMSSNDLSNFQRMAVTILSNQVVASEQRTLHFLCQDGDNGDNPLVGPDCFLRRELIRRGLEKRKCSFVNEILSMNNEITIEQVLNVAARSNLVDIVQYCIESKGADPNKPIRERHIDDNGVVVYGQAMDALHGAIGEGSVQAVEYLLTKGGANANTVIVDDGAPALWTAAQRGSVYMIKLLLQHGAHVNAHKRDTGTTSLFVAAQNGHALACSVFIKNGADVNLTCTGEQQQQQQRLGVVPPPLGIAIGRARLDIMALLLNAGASLPMACGVIWAQVKEQKVSQPADEERPLSDDTLYQMESLIEQAMNCTLLSHTNAQVKKYYQRARKLEHQGRYRAALRALVEAQTAFLHFNEYQEPKNKLRPSPPAWVQLKWDAERLTNAVYGCPGSDGRVSQWKRHVFYKDDLQPPPLIHCTSVYYVGVA